MDRLLNETSASDSEADAGAVAATRLRVRRPSASALRAVAADMRSPREVLAVQALPALASQLSRLQCPPPARTSPAPSPASEGLAALSHAVGSTPRLPPITLLTSAASVLPPVSFQQYPQQQQSQQPLLLQPRPAAVAPSTSFLSLDRASTPSGASEQVPDTLLCRYRNKKCGLPRAIKRNGDRHNLCEKHRAKANQNQRKLESKRRQQKRLLARAAQQGHPGAGLSLEDGADDILAVKKEASGLKLEAPRLHRGEPAPWTVPWVGCNGGGLTRNV